MTTTNPVVVAASPDTSVTRGSVIVHTGVPEAAAAGALDVTGWGVV
ncbi:hypothetical protein COUCH_15565 [Couchioplanes caeruleus]|nr:hypothetical protein [Couchioplanes caeruleus]UQU67597.1 hypothetical protein COUCH_15565 [Couchioplanes caeruleus]